MPKAGFINPYPASSIKPPASGIEYPESSIQFPATRTSHPATRPSHPATRNAYPAPRIPQHAPRTPQLAPRTPHPCFYFFPQSKIHNQKLPPSLLIATVAEGKLKVAATVLTSKYVDTLSNFI
jgi:hypothetical protein